MRFMRIVSLLKFENEAVVGFHITSLTVIVETLAEINGRGKLKVRYSTVEL